MFIMSRCEYFTHSLRLLKSFHSITSWFFPCVCMLMMITSKNHHIYVVAVYIVKSWGIRWKIKMKPLSWSSATCDKFFRIWLKGDCLACLRTTSMVRRMGSFQAWRCRGAKAFGGNWQPSREGKLFHFAKVLFYLLLKEGFHTIEA
jgi:hypothetical protein